MTYWWGFAAEKEKSRKKYMTKQREEDGVGEIARWHYNFKQQERRGIIEQDCWLINKDLQWKEKSRKERDDKTERRRQQIKDCWMTLQFYTARKEEV